MRPTAGRRLTPLSVLTAVLCLQAPVAGQLPKDAGRPPDDDVCFELLDAAADSNTAWPGMIGPHGNCTGQLLDAPEALLAGHLRICRETQDPSALAEPFEVSDWILSDEAAPDADIGYRFGRRRGRLLAGALHVGPVRRWLGGLFGGWRAPVDEYGPVRTAMRREWPFCPFSIGWFAGGVWGSPLMDDWVSQESGYFGGYRIGWDYTRYWGCEMRLGFGWLELADSPRAIEAQEEADTALGLPPDDPFRDRFDQSRHSDLVLWDVSLLYYPWGDTTWRPYLMAGLGAARIDFIDRLSVQRAETALAVPLAAGVKYRWCDWLALRFDVTDNIVFGSDFDAVHDFAFTGGVEIRLGGTRKAYWPWNPGRHYW